MFIQADYYLTLLTAAGSAANTDPKSATFTSGSEVLSAKGFTGQILTVVRLALTILCAILVGLTGIKLLLASIAMATAVGDEKMQKKDDLTKCLKSFGITAAVTAAVLVGGPTVTNWIQGFIDKV